jgi:hypothetical protein
MHTMKRFTHVIGTDCASILIKIQIVYPRMGLTVKAF